MFEPTGYDLLCVLTKAFSAKLRDCYSFLFFDDKGSFTKIMKVVNGGWILIYIKLFFKFYRRIYLFFFIFSNTMTGHKILV